MTKEQEEMMFQFSVYATFGCIDNPSCYTCSARNLVDDLGLNGDEMLEDLSDKINHGLKGVRRSLDQDDKIRWIFVKQWILDRLK